MKNLVTLIFFFPFLINCMEATTPRPKLENKTLEDVANFIDRMCLPFGGNQNFVGVELSLDGENVASAEPVANGKLYIGKITKEFLDTIEDENIKAKLVEKFLIYL